MMIQVCSNYPRWQLEAMAIYSAGGAEVGAGLGCGKARYGTVARFHVHVFQGEGGWGTGGWQRHSDFQRCEAMRRRREREVLCCLALTCPGQWSVRTKPCMDGWMDSRPVTVRSLVSSRRANARSGTCTVPQLPSVATALAGDLFHSGMTVRTGTERPQ